MDTSTLVTASSLDHFPYAGPMVPFLRISPACDRIQQACTVQEKLVLLEQALVDDLLVAAWPGPTGQQFYVVDDRDAAREVLERLAGSVSPAAMLSSLTRAVGLPDPVR